MEPRILAASPLFAGVDPEDIGKMLSCLSIHQRTYEREAYTERDGGDFRVTFDDTILCRQEFCGRFKWRKTICGSKMEICC